MIQSNFPSWYWHRGLHDAQIISFNFCELEYDYRIKNPIRNYIQIGLDSQGALFDNTIASIKLYNCKATFVDKKFVGFWWKSDNLKETNNKYQLEVVFSNGNEELNYCFIFDYAEIERNV